MSALITQAPAYTFNLFVIPNGTYTGSVINVDATATTMFLNDPDYGFNGTVVFGPWAQITPAPTVKTGTFDALLSLIPYDENDTETMPMATNSMSGMNMATEVSHVTALDTFSVHCQVADATVAPVCTEINVGGPSLEGPATTVITDIPYDSTSTTPILATQVVIVVTAGADKLASYDSASGSLSGASITSASGPASTSASASATGKSSESSSASGSASRTASATSSAASSSKTNAAGRVGMSFGAIGVIGLLASACML